MAMPEWEPVSASVRGSSHVRDGRPNQDAVATALLTGAVPGIVAAVADGHGGARYVRSGTGSRLAVDLACDVVTDWWVRRDGGAASRREAMVDDLLPGLVRRWRDAVVDDVAQRPFTPEEAERAGEPLEAEPLISYGATMLIAIASDKELLLAQLGDGDIVVVVSGRVLRPMPGDSRLRGGETTSLCLPEAERDFRVATVPAAERADLVLLTSDGYGNSFADPQWHESAARDIRGLIDRHGLAHVAAALSSWLGESAEMGGDDVTMALLSRPTSVAPPSPSGGRRRGLLLALVAVVVLGLIGGLLARALFGGSSRSHDGPKNAPVAAAPVEPPTSVPIQEPVRTMNGSGFQIEFVAVPADPRAIRRSQAGLTGQLTAQSGEGRWTFNSNRSKVIFRPPQGAGVEIPLGGMMAGGLALYDGNPFLWVVDRNSRFLLAIDLATHEAGTWQPIRDAPMPTQIGPAPTTTRTH
jgi:hypothetical protein